MKILIIDHYVKPDTTQLVLIVLISTFVLMETMHHLVDD